MYVCRGAEAVKDYSYAQLSLVLRCLSHFQVQLDEPTLRVSHVRSFWQGWKYASAALSNESRHVSAEKALCLQQQRPQSACCCAWLQVVGEQMGSKLACMSREEMCEVMREEMARPARPGADPIYQRA